MADLTDEIIRRTLQKIRGNDQTNWMTITYAEGTSDHFILAGSGTGGIQELAAALPPTFMGYAFLRLPKKTHELKFLLVQFVGEKCTALQKARVIVHVEDVRSAFQPFNGQVFLSNSSELTLEKVNSALVQ